MNDNDDDEDDCTKDDDDEWRWWWWWWMTVMMMNDGVDDEIEDSGGDDDERRWWKFVSGGVDDEIEIYFWWCGYEFVSRLVFFGGVGSNYVGLPVNGLDLCRVHKDSICMITTLVTIICGFCGVHVDMATNPAPARPDRPRPNLTWKSRFNRVWVWEKFWVLVQGRGRVRGMLTPAPHPPSPRTRFLKLFLLNFIILFP